MARQSEVSTPIFDELLREMAEDASPPAATPPEPGEPAAEPPPPASAPPPIPVFRRRYRAE